MKDLPSGIKDLEDLESISITLSPESNLDSISEKLNTMKSLKKIYLHGTILPKDILKTLEANLSTNNKIITLPF